MKKVVLYARVSTKDQDCERQISELRIILAFFCLLSFIFI